MSEYVMGVRYDGSTPPKPGLFEVTSIETLLNRLYLLDQRHVSSWNMFVDFNNKYGVENEYSKR